MPYRQAHCCNPRSNCRVKTAVKHLMPVLSCLQNVVQHSIICNGTPHEELPPNPAAQGSYTGGDFMVGMDEHVQQCWSSMRHMCITIDMLVHTVLPLVDGSLLNSYHVRTLQQSCNMDQQSCNMDPIHVIWLLGPQAVSTVHSTPLDKADETPSPTRNEIVTPSEPDVGCVLLCSC